MRIAEQPAAGVDIDRARIAGDLAGILEGEVRFDRHDRMLYATDASIYQVEPLGVVIPRTIDDVVATVQYAAEHGLPILPRGGGTSLAGQTVNRAIVIDCSAHLRQILEVDPRRQMARVQPGVVLDQLNAAAAPHGLMFGPDVATGSHANLGGMIGNNSAGAHSILYGRTVEHLRGLQVLFADGSRHRLDSHASMRDATVASIASRVAAIVRSVENDIDQRFPKILRRVSGYNLDLMLTLLRSAGDDEGNDLNLSHLVCGSEGTLAVTLEAELDLVPAPATKGLAIVAFESVEAALAAMTVLLETKPAAVELIDDVVIDVAQRNIEHRANVELLPRVRGKMPRAVLYVEYFADSGGDMDRKLASLESNFRGHGFQRYDQSAAMSRAWALRKAGEPLLHAIPGRRKPISFIEDVAVDPAKLGQLVAGFRDITERHGTRAAYYAHASVGCLHIRPLIDLHDAAGRESMVRIAEEAADLVRSLGGALSGEHGDGRARSPLLERFFGSNLCQAFRKIKELFDPEHRLNPGIIVDPPPMTRHLRVLPREREVAVPNVETFYRYDGDDGFGESVWQCNGAGVCRRTSGGTMCPSYRALLDERHSTRGRANALRLAITGQLNDDADGPAWDDAETLQTLDLCLSCKACKAECPSNVDVAKLKSEYLAQTYKKRGKVPLDTLLYADIRRLNRWGSHAPTIANAVARFTPVRAAINGVMRLHPRRSLPRFERSLYRWMRHRTMRVSADAPAVVLLPDCFTVYNEPRIGRAAVRSLEAFGYRVILPQLGCCGRSRISLGLLDEAGQTCSRTARDLDRAVRKHRAIAVVGLEPSCISAITDDWLQLDLDIKPEIVRSLAGKSTLLETFLADQWGDHPKRPRRFGLPIERKAVLHGHCHQKALWGMQSTINLLDRIENLAVRTIDSGCCGMAGAFGLAKDHYDLSLQIGELSVFPPIRESEDAMVLAPGTSCRHQIADALNRSARHPIEIIAEAMIDALGE